MLHFFDSDCEEDMDDFREWIKKVHDPNPYFHLFCREGHTEGVELFLQHPKIDPQASNNWGLRDAITHQQWHIVDLLLQDGRISLETKSQI